MAMVSRFDVFLVDLDVQPTGDAKNTRPAVIVSPDEMNRHIQSVLVAPLASVRTQYPTRVPVDFLNDRRSIVLDQITSVDKTRLVKKIGEVDVPTRGKIVEILAELFAE
jgi:mRNA interferase MazF